MLDMSIYILLFTSCTLRALLRLQFNLNEILYFVLIVSIEKLLYIQYFLYFLRCVDEFRFRKVFQHVSKPHIVVHVRSMDSKFSSPYTCSDILVHC
jgi:hypothetical protein